MQRVNWKAGLAAGLLVLAFAAPSSASVPKMVWTEEFGATW